MNWFFEWVILIGVIYLIIKVVTLQEKVKGMNYILDQIATKLELPENPVNDELRALLQEGKDVEAIKLARETLGLSLIEGKQYVDSIKSSDK